MDSFSCKYHRIERMNEWMNEGIGSDGGGQWMVYEYGHQTLSKTASVFCYMIQYVCFSVMLFAHAGRVV